jgi:hypothetical protein
MTHPDPATPTRRAARPLARLACPRCGHTRLSSVERLTAVGRCHAITIDAEHRPEFHWTGFTDVEWDSSTTIGVQCEHCLHTVREGPIDEILARLPRRAVRPRAA